MLKRVNNLDSFMKFTRRTVFSCIILLLFAPVVSALSIVAKEEAPYFGKDLPNQGLSYTILKTVFERAGYKTTITYETWPRAYEGALIGIYDIVGSIWYTDARAQEFIFSEPYLLHNIKFIKRKSSQQIKFNNLDDLQGLIIGTIKGYAYKQDFMQSNMIFRLQQNYLLQNLLLLTQDKIDLTLGDERKILFELNHYMKSSIKNLEFLPKPLISQGAHIAVSKSNPKHKEIIESFNKALAAMQADGSYNKIIAAQESVISRVDGE
jgi:polar amino acid transport system substrate-binding protein